MQVRRATMRDVMDMQQCNLKCLPENYNLRYYHYHICSWPHTIYVCEDINGTICGYVLGKMDDEEDPKKKHGHITSLATLRSHRKLGVASRVMEATHTDMKESYDAHFCSLHVRRTNAAARHLYQESLGYRTNDVDEGYYLDNEDAFHMKRYFNPTGGEKVGYVEKDGSLTWSALRDSPKMQKFFDQAGITMSGGDPAASPAEESKGAAAAPAAESNKGAKKGGKKGGAAPAAAATQDVDELLAEIEGSSGSGGGKKKGSGTAKGGKGKKK
jgi:peptide alpha-N-acetyltransferase